MTYSENASSKAEDKLINRIYITSYMTWNRMDIRNSTEQTFALQAFSFSRMAKKVSLAFLAESSQSD